MKKLKWSREEIQANFATCRNLDELVDEVERFFLQNGQVVCEFHVNQVRLDDEDKLRRQSTQVQDIFEIEIWVQSSQKLIEDALHSAIEFIPQIRGACLDVATVFRQEISSQAQIKFAEAVQGCQWLVETLYHIRGAAVNTGRTLKKLDQWAEQETALMGTLKELSDAYIQQDYTEVADLMEYELPQIMAKWNDVVRSEVA